ncbi:MAG: FG-GAP-like repeat-containing protein, partial [Chloroflexota bacterium]
SVQTDTPNDGQTQIIWAVSASNTTPGKQGTITFQATIDATYSNAPYTSEPVVSGDSLTNQVVISDDWDDAVTSGRSGSVIPDTSTATVQTRMPSFHKEVFDPVQQIWTDDIIEGFTGDTIQFRLTYTGATNVDAKGIVIRDFLPRGMTYVNGSDTYNNSGSFTSGIGCTSAPTTPTTTSLNGLEIVEWSLCNVTQGSVWQATIEGLIGPSPDAEPHWIVANFGKLSGHNTFGDAYSLRGLAEVDYVIPELTLTKSVDPSQGLIAGNTINYTIQVVNTGDATAYNVVMTDSVPYGIKIAATGGSGTPTSSSYTILDGDPVSGNGGTIQWGVVSSIDEDASQTFSYSAVISDGLAAGQELLNLASVAYNSRSDNTGHQFDRTGNTADINTDDAIAYVKGATVIKEEFSSFATIGDTVHWIITGTVPPGIVTYWPVVEENNLPNGFDYISGTTVVNNATLDLVNHPSNPLDNGHKDLRWFLNTIDNTSGSEDYVFSIEFDTLVTGVDGNNTANTHYDDHCCLKNADNDAFIGWYDTAAGYNNQGFAHYGTNTGRIDRRSPQADEDVKIRQPNIILSKESSHSQIQAGQTVTFTLQAVNLGNDIGYELVLTDTLPSHLTFIETKGMKVVYPPEILNITPILTDNNTVGSTDLQYELDTLYVGTYWYITYTAQVDANISAALDLINVARMADYSSKPGVVPDNNGDGLPDERYYSGSTAQVNLSTAVAEFNKQMSNTDEEFTIGSSVIFTLTVPASPLDVTMYDVLVTDTVDSRLRVDSVSQNLAGAGNSVSQTSNQVTASFDSIAPGQQSTIVIQASVPLTSSVQDGDLISNVAQLNYRNDAEKSSNPVADTLLVPAFTTDKQATPVVIDSGDTVTYTLIVNNVGGGIAKNVIINDLLPNNITYVGGSGTLNGSPLADLTPSGWSVPDLSAGGSHTIVFQALVGAVINGTTYSNTVTVTGQDVLGQAIPADNSARVPADNDLDDQAIMPVYAGVLSWDVESGFVAYEDLKNVGRVDWDYNDLIVEMEVRKGSTPIGGLVAIEVDYEVSTRGASFDHRFIHEIPLNTGGQYTLVVKDANGQTAAQESGTFTNNPAITIFDSTKAALPPTSESELVNTPLQQTYYVTGHSAHLSLLLNDPNVHTSTLSLPFPWDPYIYVYDTDQEVHLIIPGHLDNMMQVNPAFDASSPLIGYDLPLVRLFNSAWTWPIESIGIWRGYEDYVDFIDHGETTSLDWFAPENQTIDWLWQHAPEGRRPEFAQEATQASRYFASPTVVDLEGDGQVETIMADLISNKVEVYNGSEMKAGWPQTLGGGVKAAASVADLDNDGDLEIIVGAEDSRLYIFHHNGDAYGGAWPVRLGDDPNQDYRVLAKPLVVDIDKDGPLDIVVPLTNGRLYALNLDGTAKSGWPVSIGGIEDKFNSQIINSSPVSADLDGDGTLEIIVGSYDKHLYIFNADGTLVASYLAGDVIISTPAVGEVDTTVAGQEIAFGSGDGYLYILAKDGNLLWRQATGWTIRSSPLIVDMDNDNQAEILIGSDDNHLWAWNHDGSRVTGWPQETQSDVFSSPAFGDIDGDGQGEIIVGSDDGHIYAWHVNGEDVAGWPKEASKSVKGTPALVDADGDGTFEVVVGDFGGIFSDDWEEFVNNGIYLPFVVQ